MNASDHVADIVAIQQTISRMTHCFDAGEYDAGAACYAADAVWHRPDGTLSGRAAIAGYYNARPANAVICHVLSNFVVDFEGDGNAVCTYYSMGFRHMAEGQPKRPVPMEGPGALWRYRDRMAKQGGDWKVVERRAERIFELGA